MLTHPKSLARVGQALLIVAIGLVTWMQRAEPYLNPTYAPISFYARAQHGWMLLVVLVVTAVAILMFSRAYALTSPGSQGVRPMTLTSIAVTLAAVIRAHPYFPWEGPPTIEGTLHLVFSVAGMLLFACAAFIISRERTSRLLLALAAIFFAASAFTCAEAGMTLLLGQKPQYMGAEERLIFLVGIAWLFALFPPWRKVRLD